MKKIKKLLVLIICISMSLLNANQWCVMTCGSQENCRSLFKNVFIYDNQQQRFVRPPDRMNIPKNSLFYVYLSRCDTRVGLTGVEKSLPLYEFTLSQAIETAEQQAQQQLNKINESKLKAIETAKQAIETAKQAIETAKQAIETAKQQAQQQLNKINESKLKAIETAKQQAPQQAQQIEQQLTNLVTNLENLEREEEKRSQEEQIKRRRGLT